MGIDTMNGTFRSLVLATAMAGGGGVALSAQATPVTINTAAIYDPGTVTAAGVENRNEYASAVEFGVTEGSGATATVETLYAFCIDLTHNIAVDFDQQAGHDIVSAQGDAQNTHFNYAYQTSTLTRDSVGGGSGVSGAFLTSTQIGEIGGLANLGRGFIADANINSPADSQDLSDRLAAVQGAIWRIEYPQPNTFTATGNVGSLIDTYVAEAPQLAVVGPVTTIYAVDGSSQGFVVGSTPPGVGLGGNTGPVPEPASWALMIMGFGAAGTALRSRRSVAVGTKV